MIKCRYNNDLLNEAEARAGKLGSLNNSIKQGKGNLVGYIGELGFFELFGAIMEDRKPPLRIVAPGRVDRPDTVDASHSFMFHQIEGLMDDDSTTFSDLKGILHLFLRELFGKDTKMRFRPHYFPFTEPSVEVDISCFACKGGGCRTCGRTGWIEVLGAGTVDPAVFEQVGYNPKKVQGFAFGLGVERIAMLKYGIDDIRKYFENDLRFLRQF